MPPSWMRSLHDSVAAKPLPPELDSLDWSRSLAMPGGRSLFREGMLCGLPLPGEVSCMSFDPMQSLLAVGTTVGTVHVFGSPAVQLAWTLRPASKVKHLLWRPGSPILVVADEKDNLSIYDVSRVDPAVAVKSSANSNPFDPAAGVSLSGAPHPDTPMRVGAHSARNSVIAMELSPSHSHLFLGLRDGTVDAYDLERLCPSPYRVPNLWWEEEEILRKSGVPDAPSRLHVPMIVDIATRPNELGQLLLAYEGGVVLLDVKERSVLKSFQLRLLPGAPGAGTGDANAMWTERSSPVTAVAWRPDGAVFAAGHEDGCISFWSTEEEEKPLMVRTLDDLDVDKPQAFETMMQQPQSVAREPIFKLAWAGFPEQGWLNLGGSSGGPAGGAGPTASSSGTASRDSGRAATKGTILTVLGGMAIGRDPPGVACLHFPAFQAPLNVSIFGNKTAEAAARLRGAYQASLEAHTSSRYVTESTVEDFLLLPRHNPHYSMAHDPTSIIFLVAPDEKLPTLPPPAAARGLVAFAYPPEMHHITPLNPVTPIYPRPRRLHLPLALSVAGSGAILGTKIVNLGHSLANYRKLTGVQDVTGGAAKASGAAAELASEATDRSKARIPLHGGQAHATLAGVGASSSETPEALARTERFRLLVTWHLDGSVRFHDITPHLLLLGDDVSSTASSELTSRVLKRSFPNPLPHLTVDVRALLLSRANAGIPALDKLRMQAASLRVVDVHVAPEVLETSVVLRTGQVLHFRFGFARMSETQAFQEDLQQELEHDRREVAELASSAQRFSTSPRMGRASGDVSDLVAPMQAMGREGEPSSQVVHQPPRSAPTPDPHSPKIGAGVAALGPPPPRPKRDPKRLGHALRSSIGLSTTASSDASTSKAAEAGRDSVGSLEGPRSVEVARASGPGMHVDEITALGHLADPSTDGFKPNILIDLSCGEITAFAASDVGFLALAHGTGLGIVDLRVPELLLRQGFGDGRDSTIAEPSDHHETREQRKTAADEAKAAVTNLHFAICRTSDDTALKLRLVATRTNGLVSVWSLSRSLDVWLCERAGSHQVDALASPVFVDVLDRGGNACAATPASLQHCHREQERGGVVDDETLRLDVHTLVGAGSDNLVTRVGITGPRLASAQVGERVMGAGLVERHGEKVLLVLTESSMRIYSLPRLELVTRLQRHYREQGAAMTSASYSVDSNGDLIEHLSSLDVRLWTVFAQTPRAGPPRLDLYSPTAASKLPMYPGAVGATMSNLASWLGGKSSSLTAGAALDELLAGPERPEPPNLPEPKHVHEAQRQLQQLQRQRELQRQSEDGATAAATAGAGASKSQGARKAVNQAGTTAAWNVDLARQRGEMMNSLEDGLNSLERGVQDWVKSTKTAMVSSAAKDKFSRTFGL